MHDHGGIAPKLAPESRVCPSVSSLPRYPQPALATSVGVAKFVLCLWATVGSNKHS